MRPNVGHVVSRRKKGCKWLRLNMMNVRKETEMNEAQYGIDEYREVANG